MAAGNRAATPPTSSGGNRLDAAIWRDAGYLLDITDQVSAADKADYLARAAALQRVRRASVGRAPGHRCGRRLLYNKGAREGGRLDPENPPKTWTSS